ncbi:hypothetical protein Bache_0122 [Bacteroides helcogenes P 36-108]|uniref:Uncharacterized protein n=1 Tax=Bacteroides helcogenes (strain ATCC 35417 / DSM 20613 / JCM 6297 / CCUG 15421 / P 36-108) TaxID=693979 RepID=E6SSI0_BACT6|nr:hypothetical protein Bache_0122 [Bacteroides helcogenes P 36-108]
MLKKIRPNMVIQQTSHYKKTNFTIYKTMGETSVHQWHVRFTSIIHKFKTSVLIDFQTIRYGYAPYNKQNIIPIKKAQELILLLLSFSIHKGRKVIIFSSSYCLSLLEQPTLSLLFLSIEL